MDGGDTRSCSDHDTSPALRGLGGDRGARNLLQERAGDLSLIAVEDPGVLVDLDTPDDLKALS